MGSMWPTFPCPWLIGSLPIPQHHFSAACLMHEGVVWFPFRAYISAATITTVQ